MVKLSTLAAVGLLLSGCRLGAAGPDDEQVLVQRATFVQPEKTIEIENEVSKVRKEIAGVAEGLKAAEAISRQAGQVVKAPPQGKNTVGTAGGICSAQDMKNYEDAVKAYIKAQKEGAIELAKHLVNYTASALNKMVHPLLDADKAILTDGFQKAKPNVLDILKYYMFKAVKPAKKYDVSMLASTPEASTKEIEHIIHSSAKQWQAIGSKAWVEWDELLNKKVEEMPDIKNNSLVHMDMSPWINWDGNETKPPTNLGDYWAFKAAPIVALAVFPVLSESLMVFSNLPKKQEDLIPFILEKVAPALGVVVKTMMAGTDGYLLSAADFPIRVCATCNERYASEVAQFGSANSCLGQCIESVSQCATVTDKTCMQTSRSCLQCHADKLANFDACNGDTAHEKQINQLRGITAEMESAVDKQGFDKFLLNITARIVKGE